MLVLCNGKREGGGFQVAPQASQKDGVLDYTAITTISRPRMLLTIPYFMKGTQGQLSYARGGSFSDFSLETDRPLFIHTDGEIYAGFHSTVTSLKVKAVPRAVRMVAPGMGS
jgi:diacylglycerol kinase family enzyme